MPSPSSPIRITHNPGSVIFEEGQPGESAYLIVEGKVEIRIGNRGSNPHTLATCGRGEVIGEMALFDGHTHLGSAVAVETTTLISMSQLEFEQRVETVDPVMRGIVLLMVRRLRQAVWHLKPESGEVNWAKWQREKKK